MPLLVVVLLADGLVVVVEEHGLASIDAVYIDGDDVMMMT